MWSEDLERELYPRDYGHGGCLPVECLPKEEEDSFGPERQIFYEPSSKEKEAFNVTSLLLSLFIAALLTLAIARLAKADSLGGGGGGGPLEKAKRSDVLAEIAKADSLDGGPYQELDLNWQCIGNCCLPHCGIAQVLTPKPQPPTGDDDDIIYIPPPYLPHCENPFEDACTLEL